MNRRSALRSAAALAVVAALMTIAPSAGTAQPTETVTMRAMFPNTARLGWEIIVKNFERVFPNIKVDAQYLDSGPLSQLLITQFQAGNAPDLVFMQPGTSIQAGVWPLADAGRLMNLSGRKWQKRVPAAAMPYVSRKGKIYAWPMAMFPYGAIYNVDLFRQLGLKVPTRFSEVLSMCGRIKARGKIPFVQGFGNLAAGIIIGRQRMAQHVYSVDPSWDVKRARKQVTFAGSPLWRRALQSVVDMKNAGCFQEGAQGTSRPQQYAMFARGEAVMSIIAASELSNFTVINPNLKIEILNVPPDNPKRAAVLATPALTLGVSAVTRYPAQARTFIDFVAREQQSALFAKVAGGVAPLDAQKNRLPAYMKPLAPLFKAGKVDGGHESGWPNPVIFNQGYATGIMGLITGQTNIDGILREMDRLWDAS